MDGGVQTASAKSKRCVNEAACGELVSFLWQVGNEILYVCVEAKLMEDALGVKRLDLWI